jgi:uncharacterized membrane protein
MSDLTPRRASLVSILAIFALFALFAVVVYYIYAPRRTGAYTGVGSVSDEQRVKNLAELRAKEAEAATSYGWVDQNAGVVRLPLERAQELTLQQYAKKK